MLRENINLTLHATSLHHIKRCTQRPYIAKFSILNSQFSTQETMNKNELWQKIIHIAITILTAIATTFGVTSCIGLMN